jgi:crossover junction endodeoxyribonuclease RusA
VTLTFCPPDRFPRDMDNLVAALKSGLDGMCRALGIDDHQIVPVPDQDWGPVVKGGKVEVTIVEIPT